MFVLAYNVAAEYVVFIFTSTVHTHFIGRGVGLAFAEFGILLHKLTVVAIGAEFVLPENVAACDIVLIFTSTVFADFPVRVFFA